MPEFNDRSNNEIVTLAIANEIIRNCRELGVIECAPRIELLVYFTAGWYYGINEKPLLLEPIYAGHEGPYIYSLRGQLEKWDKNPILDYFRKINELEGRCEIINLPPGDDKAHKVKFIKTTCRAFRKASLENLQGIAKISGGAWDIAKAGSLGKNKVIIHPEIMQQHFYSVAREISLGKLL